MLSMEELHRWAIAGKTGKVVSEARRVGNWEIDPHIFDTLRRFDKLTAGKLRMRGPGQVLARSLARRRDWPRPAFPEVTVGCRT